MPIARIDDDAGAIHAARSFDCVIWARPAKDMQKQIDEVRSALPKFAIPMREVGDRFQNMCFAARGGNWALAACMSRYMNGSMTPASVIKPAEYKV